jgi:hypothetical protein
MKRFGYSLIGLAAVAAVGLWLLPHLMWRIPSRYVAAYFPEPVQAWAVSGQVAVLPTADAPVDASALLAVATVPPTPTATPTATATVTLLPNSTAEPVPPTAVPTSTPLPTATPSPTPTPLPFNSSARLTNITHHFQEWNNCGPATLAMGLSYFGIYKRQSETAALLKPNPEDRNVTPQEIAHYVNANTSVRALTRANGDLDTVRRLLTHGIPVIIETGIDPPGSFSWMEWYGHYLMVVAYDDTAETVWVFDSWLGTTDEIETSLDEEGNVIAQGSQTGNGRTLSYAEFDQYWRQFNRTYLAFYRPEQEGLLRTLVGAQLNDERMWQDALARTQAELAAEPNDAFLWFNLGTNLTELGEYESAALAFDKARELGLPARMLWYQFGPYEAYFQIGRYDEVIALTSLTLDRRPYFEESFYYRGLAKQALGRTAEADADFASALRFNPHNPLVQGH